MIVIHKVFRRFDRIPEQVEHHVKVLKNKRLLLIEPSDSVRNNLKLHFERRGMTVHTAGKVEKLQTMIEGANVSHAPFDVILIDVRLPECFDFFALRRINELLAGRKVPIFVMSHGFSRFAIRQLTRYRVMGYIRKPFTIEQLDRFLIDRLEFFADQIREHEMHNELLQDQKPKRALAG